MAFDAESLLHDLFPEPPPRRAPAEPQEAERSPPPALSPPLPAHPRNRLPGALPSPPPGEWLPLWRQSPEFTLPPKPCGWCGCPVFVRNHGGRYHCGNCRIVHFPERVEMWVELVATEDGPQVVRLADCQVESRMQEWRRKRRSGRR
jgi:ribosomal protein S27AE